MTERLYYKGFNDLLQCKSFQYEVGQTYTMDEPIRLCGKGFHFCKLLTQVFSFYPRVVGHGSFILSDKRDKYNKFAVISVPEDAEIQEDKVKCCSNRITIVRVLTNEEIEQIVESEKLLVQDSIYNLDLVQKLQSKYNCIIVGSTALYLHGLNIKRDNTNHTDLDVILPYYQQISDVDGYKIRKTGNKKSGNSFDFSLFAMSNGGDSTLTIDIKIDPHSKYEEIEYNGFTYKVSPIIDIFEAKIKYIKAGGNGTDKHLQDILGLLRKRT